MSLVGNIVPHLQECTYVHGIHIGILGTRCGALYMNVVWRVYVVSFRQYLNKHYQTLEIYF